MLSTTAEFVNPPLQRKVSFAKGPERPTSGVCSSFAREVDKYFQSDPDRGVDEKYSPPAATVSDNKASARQPGLGRLDRKSKTRSLDLDSIRAGPYSTTNTISSDSEAKHISSASLDDIEKRVEKMIERHQARRAKDVAFYLYAIATSMLAVAAIVLAALALGHIKDLRTAPTTIVLGQIPTSAPEQSSSLQVGGVSSTASEAAPPTSPSSHPHNTCHSLHLLAMT